MPEQRSVVRITRTRLADNRALTYYDDREPYLSGTATRAVPDPRELSPYQAQPTMRLDVLTGEWVILAAHRMDRTHLPAAGECPLCPSRDGKMTEIPAQDYDVVVFDNRFPSLAPQLNITNRPVPAAVDGEPLWPQQPAMGRCRSRLPIGLGGVSSRRAVGAG